MAGTSGRAWPLVPAAWLPLLLLLLLLGQGCTQSLRSEICLQTPAEGPCRASVNRWYYDRYTQTCTTFSYGGCEGNSNNFMSRADCFRTCGSIKKVPKYCRLDVDEGPCRALLKRYFFNLATMTCQKFYYGGCEGNENRFDDVQSCMDSCVPVKTAPSFCYEPKDEGFCSASVPRFYYNIRTKKCEEFTYTGCGGNNNNFVDKDSCSKACSKGRKPSFLRPIYRRLRKPHMETRDSVTKNT